MQWLVFRNNGTTSAAAFAQQAAQYGGRGGGLWDMFGQNRQQQRQAFVLQVLRQSLAGLAYMHARNRCAALQLAKQYSQIISMKSFTEVVHQPVLLTPCSVAEHGILTACSYTAPRCAQQAQSGPD